MTVPLGLANFQGAHSTQWTLLMAGNVMSLVPMMIIFFRRSGTSSGRWRQPASRAPEASIAGERSNDSVKERA